MTKKNYIVLAITLVSVIGFYLYLFRDSFRKPGIQISHTIRLNPAYIYRPPQGATAEELPHIIGFGLGGDFKLTSIKIVPVAELETNKFAHPVWELVSDSNSVPTRSFIYGHKIKGMHSAVKGAAAEPLTTDTPYRLLVETQSLKGQHDFTITEEAHLAQ